jgi:hypothetical protein
VPVFKFRNLNTGQAMPIPEGEFVVGRANEAYVHVDDSSVSRNHARLLNSTEGLFIEDLGSSNGTAMKGAYLTTRTSIKVGTIIHIGSVPFRVDPEVAGEVETKPAPSTRGVSMASMSRATERIPAAGEAPRVVIPVAADKLAAPEVNPAESDADELNAVVIREPQAKPAPAVAVAPVTPAAAVATASPSASTRPIQAIPGQGGKARPASAVKEYLPKSTTPSSAQVEAPDITTSPAPQQQERGKVWDVILFLAGLGVGLLLGLIFAKVFIDMGGKPAGLP